MAGSSGSPMRRLGLPAVRRSTRSAGAVACCAASGVAGRLASGPQRGSRPLSHPPEVGAPLDLVALSVLRTRMADHPAWPRSSPGGMPLLLAPEGGVASAGLIGRRIREVRAARLTEQRSGGLAARWAGPVATRQPVAGIRGRL